METTWLNAEQSAAYLGITVKALYCLIERRRLRKAPGFRKIRFTKEQLDSFLKGENHGEKGSFRVRPR